MHWVPLRFKNMILKCFLFLLLEMYRGCTKEPAPLLSVGWKLRLEFRRQELLFVPHLLFIKGFTKVFKLVLLQGVYIGTIATKTFVCIQFSSLSR